MTLGGVSTFVPTQHFPDLPKMSYLNNLSTCPRQPGKFGDWRQGDSSKWNHEQGVGRLHLSPLNITFPGTAENCMYVLSSLLTKHLAKILWSPVLTKHLANKIVTLGLLSTFVPTQHNISRFLRYAQNTISDTFENRIENWTPFKEHEWPQPRNFRTGAPTGHGLQGPSKVLSSDNFSGSETLIFRLRSKTYILLICRM